MNTSHLAAVRQHADEARASLAPGSAEATTHALRQALGLANWAGQPQDPEEWLGIAAELLALADLLAAATRRRSVVAAEFASSVNVARPLGDATRVDGRWLPEAEMQGLISRVAGGIEESLAATPPLSTLKRLAARSRALEAAARIVSTADRRQDAAARVW